MQLVHLATMSKNTKTGFSISEKLFTYSDVAEF